MVCRTFQVWHTYASHFVILYKISDNNFFIANPSIGLHTVQKETFLVGWADVNNEGHALLLEPI